MNLWTIVRAIDGWLVLDNQRQAVAMCHREADALLIRDEHNAWVILMQRGWSVIFKDGKYHVPQAHCGNYCAADDTPRKAILAADAWLKERGQ